MSYFDDLEKQAPPSHEKSEIQNKDNPDIRIIRPENWTRWLSFWPIIKLRLWRGLSGIIFGLWRDIFPIRGQRMLLSIKLLINYK
jgi:hypothetical protein